MGRDFSSNVEYTCYRRRSSSDDGQFSLHLVQGIEKNMDSSGFIKPRTPPAQESGAFEFPCQ